MRNFIVGISGASGIILGYKLITQLIKGGYAVHVVMSKDAYITAYEEILQGPKTLEQLFETFSEEERGRVKVYKNNDFRAPFASGTFQTDGMAITPCSMATLAAIAIGLSDNLLRRAADVVLKERRRLVIVPREAPLSETHLENMLKLTRQGAVILPPSPAWYNHPKSLDDVESYIVGKTLDLLHVQNDIYARWNGGIGIKEGRGGGIGVKGKV